METTDVKKSHKHLYQATQQVKEVTAAHGTFLAVDGMGKPGGEAYQEAINRLFSLAYTAKFALKKAGKLDFKVAPLECLWYDNRATTPVPEWRWRLLIRIPDQVCSEDLEKAKAQVAGKKGLDTSAVQRTKWEEGRTLQVMHIGPYDTVGDTYRVLKQHAEDNGLSIKGMGHEVYISDPRRTAPEKLKTIVRMQVGST